MMWLVVPLTTAQAAAWKNSENVTLNPAMQGASADEAALAVADALSYYKLSDYGHGDCRPLDAEQQSLRIVIDSVLDGLLGDAGD